MNGLPSFGVFFFLGVCVCVFLLLLLLLLLLVVVVVVCGWWWWVVVSTVYFTFSNLRLFSSD